MAATSPSRGRALMALLRPGARRWAVLGALLGLSSALALAGPLVVKRIVDRATEGASASELAALAIGVPRHRRRHPGRGCRGRAPGDDHRLGHHQRLAPPHDPPRARARPRVPPQAQPRRADPARRRRRHGGVGVPRPGRAEGGRRAAAARRHARRAARARPVAGSRHGRLPRDRDRPDGPRCATAPSREASDEMGAYARLYGGIEERLTAAEDLRANGASVHAVWRFVEDSAGTLDDALRRERAFIRMWWAVQSAVDGRLGGGADGQRHARRQRGDHDRHRLPAVPVRAVDDPPAGGAGRTSWRRSRRRTGRWCASSTCWPSRRPSSTPARRRRRPDRSACRAVACRSTTATTRRSSTTSTSRSRPVARSASSGARAAARRPSPGCSCVSSKRRRARSSLGGVPIADIPMAELRRRVALVPQEVELFEGTIRDNVTLFDGTASDDDVADALRRAGLDALVAGGIDRPLGAGRRRPLGRRGAAAGAGARLAAPPRPRRARRGHGAHRPGDRAAPARRRGAADRRPDDA